MATRTKTIEFATKGAAFADNTLSTATQITVYIPESGKTFRSVYAILSVGTLATATGNLTSRNLQCRLGAAGYTSNSNANLYTGSAEDMFIFHAVDLTAHFTANWTGTSMTFDSQYQLDGTWTGVSFVNPCVTLVITYDYDDTSSTQIKTVKLPLNAPASALATTSGSAEDTIPLLDTELPESSKAYRDAFITIQGNIERAGTGDPTLSVDIDGGTTVTSSAFEGVSNTDYFYRWLVKSTEIDWDPSSTMGFNLYASAADFDHPQVWLTVTYEFDATASTDCYVSVMIPVKPLTMGTSATTWARTAAELWIPEAGVASKRIAFYSFWEQQAAIAGLNMGAATAGSFTAYSSVAATVAGSCAAMRRDDTNWAVARGKNVLELDVYRTDTTDLGAGFSGFFIVTYTCDKPSGGYGAANRTVLYNNGQVFNSTAAATWLTAAINSVAGFTSWSQKRFISSFGMMVRAYTNSTAQATGWDVQAEKLSTELGERSWESLGSSSMQTDPETGLHVTCFDFTKHFEQFDGHLGRRFDPTAARRWRISNSGYLSTGWSLFQWMMTYHEVTFTVADSITGFSGTVTLGLHMEADSAKFIDDVRVLQTTRSGDGAFSFTWYDPVEQVYVVASDGTNVGRSTADVAT